MLQHSISAIRRNDPQADVGCIGHLVLVGLAHGAGMKGCDLVVVLVGGDRTLGGIQRRNLNDVLVRDAVLLQAPAVVLEVFADRGHWNRLTAEKV